MQLRHRHLGPDQDPVLALGSFEVTRDLVQLVQAPAVGVGNQ